SSSGPAARGRSASRRAGNGRSAAPSWYWRQSRRRRPGGQDQTCPVLASSAGALAPRPRAPAPPRAGFFLKGPFGSLKNGKMPLRLPGILCLCIARTASSRVRSGRRAIRPSRKSACFSNGETLPPRGLAVQRPVSRKHWTQIIAVLALTSNSSAAARRDAPLSTSAIPRARMSSEYAFGIPQPPKTESMPIDSLILRPQRISLIQLGRNMLLAWRILLPPTTPSQRHGVGHYVDAGFVVLRDGPRSGWATTTPRTTQLRSTPSRVYC